jgi:uncharacterized protein
MYVEAILIFFAAFTAGAINSVAGGGTFVLFPTLLRTLPSLEANAVNAVAVWPGSLGSIPAYWSLIRKLNHWAVARLTSVYLVGGVVGAWLLLNTTEVTFKQIIPFLSLLASLVFAFSDRIKTWAKARSKQHQHKANDSADLNAGFGTLLAMFMIAVYGGYFGAGIGVMTLASLSLLGMENVHKMNAVKVLLTSTTNMMAAFMLIPLWASHIPHVMVSMLGAVLGGYLGARMALKLPPLLVRRAVIVIAFTVTGIFFIRTFGGG